MEEILQRMRMRGITRISDGDRGGQSRETVLEFALGIKNTIDRELLLCRLQGVTLQEIGDRFGLTRERIRQRQDRILCKRTPNEKQPFAEDCYADLFRQYAISKEIFCQMFNENTAVYNYLDMFYKRGKLPLVQLLKDPAYPPEIKHAVEKIVYKNYVCIDGEWVYRSRSYIADYVVRIYFKEETTFYEFMKCYDAVLADLGLSDDEELQINTRTYENRLADSIRVLWKLGSRFRYYDVTAIDPTYLLTSLDLEQYHNVEYSSLKFFREYPEVMRHYDIRDGYELHNLLKKLFRRKKGTINFGRMPTIEFGQINRHKQVMELLIELTPVSVNDFAAAYERAYGIRYDTVKSNYLSYIEEYLNDGIYEL